MKHLLGSRPADQLSTPYFSPALHPPLPLWPPTLVYYGKTERFVASITALVSQFGATAGVSVTAYAADEIPERFSHDFLIFLSVERAWPKEVRQCWERIKAWTKSLEAA